MKKWLWLLLALIVVLGGGFMGKSIFNKEESLTALKENEILVNVISVDLENNRFTGKVVTGNDLVQEEQEIVFTYESSEPLKELKEENQVILELPKLPIMTNSLPPQMPKTEIISID